MADHLATLAVDIDSTGTGPDTIVKVNGEVVDCLTSLKYEVSAGGFATLTLVAEGVPIHIAGMAAVEVVNPEPKEADRG